MNKLVLIITYLILTTSTVYSQDSLIIGKRYFEDQLYFAFMNNALINKPDGLLQKGMSTAIQIGVIKDLPLNKKGSIAIGVGLGYAFNTYNQNIKISETNPEYSLINNNYETNRIETHSIEFPIELRLRLTSTPTVYRFWRVYFGGKIRYVFASTSLYKNIEEVISKHSISNINKLQYGPQLAIGYNALNIYLFYDLKPLFKEDKNEIELSQIKSLSFGFQFYIF
jgi:hypothetical protein